MAATSTLPPHHEARPDARPGLRILSSLRLVQAVSLWHLTSLDAPTVAVVWCIAFARAEHVRLPLWVPIVLALSAWVFYVADRLCDARKAYRSLEIQPREAFRDLRPRHHFHWHHRRFFVPLAMTAAAAALTIVDICMPFAVRERNSLLAFASLAYFGSVHGPWQMGPWRMSRARKRDRDPRRIALRIPKELLVALLFTLTCAAPTFFRSAGHRLELLPPIVVYIALAWLNCHAIEVWESAENGRAGSTSIFPMAAGLAGAALLCTLLGTAAGPVFAPSMDGLLATAAASAALIAILDRLRRKLPATPLRAAVDLALLAPLALLALR